MGNYYGTSMEVIREKLDKGVDVLLDIEVQGAAKVREKLPEAVTLFLIPPSFEELSRRLHARGTDSEEQIAQRPGERRRRSYTMTTSSSTTRWTTRPGRSLRSSPPQAAGWNGASI